MTGGSDVSQDIEISILRSDIVSKINETISGGNPLLLQKNKDRNNSNNYKSDLGYYFINGLTN